MAELLCRVLGFAGGDGPRNMAIDQWMLETVAADPSAALLRTYGWSVPTLSLGYFQSIAEAEADSRWASVPIVRRSTGGGAIWHDHELTYAVVLPSTHPLARRAADLSSRVHAAFASLLNGLGVSADARGQAEGRAGPDRPFLCFLDRDPSDLVVGQTKLVGSAQRRRAGAILQQGSFLLKGSAMTPELPGLVDVAPPGKWPVGPRAWSAEVVAGITRGLGLVAAPSCLPSAEVLASYESSYRDLEWTRRR